LISIEHKEHWKQAKAERPIYQEASKHGLDPNGSPFLLDHHEIFRRCSHYSSNGSIESTRGRIGRLIPKLVAPIHALWRAPPQPPFLLGLILHLVLNNKNRNKGNNENQKQKQGNKKRKRKKQRVCFGQKCFGLRGLLCGASLEWLVILAIFLRHPFE
jgi:hypothetical protein